ncbi:hypothetical protein AEAC466_02835 [Asticcacaulis sp. AC466]|uniref:hypothetical protein n=1 Tax=Asticcacaulis sp. AC466 TaxID=1282362 RepID=UPI0003C40C21|nr:hypothetical protein [Asticcacaulis sp. AC466]ESQ86144.1 hypothetical protein AEAC466_02835 [Asticcacaulis sp. AC466]
MTTKPPVTAKDIGNGFKAFLADERFIAFVNYGLLMFTVMTFGLSAMVALLIANFVEDKAPDWLKGHYTFQKRTFWYAIGPVLLTAVAYTFVQRHAIASPVINIVVLGLVLASLGYTVGRAIMGFNHLLHSRPVPNATTWLV